MKISTKGRYGLRALIDLAMNSKEEHVALVSVAERQGISVQYLEQVFAALRKAGILKSVKGPKGGYSLGMPAEELLVGDVLRVLEGELSLMESMGYGRMEDLDAVERAVCLCLWRPLDHMTLTHLSQVTIADLVTETERQAIEGQDMFYI